MSEYCIEVETGVIHSADCKDIGDKQVISKDLGEILKNSEKVQLHRCVSPHDLKQYVGVIRRNKVTYTGVHNDQLLYVLESLYRQSLNWQNTTLYADIARRFHKVLSYESKALCILNVLKSKLSPDCKITYDEFMDRFIVVYGLEQWGIEVGIDSYQYDTNRFPITLLHYNKLKTRKGVDWHKQFSRNCTLNDITSYICGHDKYFRSMYRLGHTTYYRGRKR